MTELAVTGREVTGCLELAVTGEEFEDECSLPLPLNNLKYLIGNNALYSLRLEFT